MQLAAILATNYLIANEKMYEIHSIKQIYKIQNLNQLLTPGSL